MPGIVAAVVMGVPAPRPMARPCALERCPAEPAPAFSAALRAVTMGDRVGTRFVTVDVGVRNQGREALTLGYVTSALVVSDSGGTRYGLVGRALGLQPIHGTQFDAALTVDSGASATVRLDFEWSSRDAPPVSPTGLRLVLDEVARQAGPAATIVREWQLQFRTLGAGDTALVRGRAAEAAIADGAEARTAGTGGAGQPAARPRTDAAGDTARQGLLDAARKLLQIIPKKP